MSDLQMDYMLIKRERLDALLRVVEDIRNLRDEWRAQAERCKNHGDPVALLKIRQHADDLEGALRELDEEADDE
jgi:hypothetical protein